jgi:hypothetical protein
MRCSRRARSTAIATTRALRHARSITATAAVRVGVGSPTVGARSTTTTKHTTVATASAAVWRGRPRNAATNGGIANAKRMCASDPPAAYAMRLRSARSATMNGMRRAGRRPYTAAPNAKAA